MNLIILLLEDFISRAESPTCTDSTCSAENTTANDSTSLHAVMGVAELHDERRVSHIREVLRAETGDLLKVGQLGGLIGTAKLKFLNEAKSAVRLEDVRLDRVLSFF